MFGTVAMMEAGRVNDQFDEWLALNLGPHKWIVARRSKARVKGGLRPVPDGKEIQRTLKLLPQGDDCD